MFNIFDGDIAMPEFHHDDLTLCGEKQMHCAEAIVLAELIEKFPSGNR